MIIAGIDYSMTSPAICVFDTDKELKFENLLLFNLNDVKKYQGIHGNIDIRPIPKWTVPELRYRSLSDWAISILQEHKVECVQLEGYSMGSNSGLVFNIAENTSVLKQKMYDLGIKVQTPSPSQVKKNFTGKGNANKQAMCEEFIRRFGVKMQDILNGVEFGAPENDLVDSLANMLTHPSFAR